jgi:hypothetical protein
MTGARFRLAIAAVLFLGWLGWLAYLAFTTTRPVVLSRPQLLVSTLDVIAQVSSRDSAPDPDVVVEEVHWPPSRQAELVGHALTVTNLAACQGWTGPGIYILPLVSDGAAYQVAGIPPSPGFIPARADDRPRIYPKTPETVAQLEEIHKR